MQHNRRALLVMCPCFFLMVALNYVQFQLSPAAAQVMEELRLTKAQFSSIFTAALLPSIALSLFGGLLSDRFGSERVIFVGAVLAALGMVLRVFADNYWQMTACMCMAGIGGLAMNLNIPKLAAAWFPPRSASRVTGKLLAGTAAGMTLGMLSGAWFSSLKTAYWAGAAACLAGLALWLPALWVRPPRPQNEQVDKPPFFACLKAAAKSRPVWIAGACLACIMGCSMSVNAFLPTALQQVRGMDAAAAGAVTAAAMIANFFGGACGPILFEKTGSFRGVLLCCGALNAAASALAWRLPAGVWMFAGFLVMGFTLGCFFGLLQSLPLLLPEVGQVYAGTAGGIINTLSMLGGVALPALVVVPLSGGSYANMFLLGGGLMAVMCCLTLLLPRVCLGPSDR